ncbi:hypothetical protein QKU48_gp0522 [Fadolivirus algeromassiliense]|jgi:hypothetical protein|uniref:Uncharacterized protein n=1 Tax=Fadolivirus FV1/VV64 TaxID=3070911 RepID=A0A7D3QX02_9VIRU|nr:hypothetical protein QKU48_gp0522 [Fadolivirus algeromassiliense]QKF93980.1 hypothetical protein Fadolivirus_1_522 [Fadolivirus FV1/VV64]
MNKEIISLISDFNDTLLSLALNIANICPTSVLGTNIKDIEKQIKRKDNFTKFIDMFCIKVLQYKDQIDAGDESFFMNKDYSKDLEGQESVSFDYVLSFKSIWNQLKKENKQIVILNMQILCELSQQYFNFIQSSMKK